MNQGKKQSSEECEAPAEAWINGSNGTVNRTEQRLANLMQMLEHNRESQERNLKMVAMNHTIAVIPFVVNWCHGNLYIPLSCHSKGCMHDFVSMT